MSEPQSDPGVRLRLGVLISGAGTTLANLERRIADGRLRGVRIRVVVASRRRAAGVQVARQADLPVHVVRPRDYGDTESFSLAVARVLDAAAVDLVLMAGFLTLWRFPRRYERRVLNIHPALLPDFGGRGMYGLRVHEAVLRAGVRETGCTVHLADHEYDHGPIVAQSRVPVRPGDTPETLAQRVAQAERDLYPQVVQRIADEGLAWLDQAATADPSGGPLARDSRNR